MMSIGHLNDSFFNQTEAIRQALDKWLSAHQWNAQCLPVYEWQDILYIAVTSPPTEEMLNLNLVYSGETKKKVFLLSSPHALSELWLTLDTKKPSEVLPTLSPTSQKPSESSPFDFLNEDMPSASSEAVEGLEGFSLSDTDESAPAAEAVAPEEPQEELLELAPADTEKKATPEVSAALVLEPLSREPAAAVESAPEVQAVAIPPAPALPTKKPMAPPPPPPVADVVPLPSVKDFSAAKGHPAKPEESALASRTPAGLTWEELRSLAPEYSSFIIFKNRGRGAEPTFWSSSASQIELSEPINIDALGAFKIVTKTKLPYHGPTVNDKTVNHIADKFGFTLQEDSTVTIVPIVEKDQVDLYVFAVGGSSAFTEKSLLQVERLAQVIAEEKTSAA